MPSEVNAIRIATYSALAGVFVMFALALSLRPIADDYALGVRSQNGAIEGIVGTWTDWSGDLIRIALDILLVGLPTVYAPWPLVSALAFVSTSCAVSLLCVGLVAPIWIQHQRVTKSRVVLHLAPVFLVLWWGYWWTNATVSLGDHAASLANGITFWQSINVAYVLLPTLILLLFVCSWSRSRTSWTRLLLLASIGITLGLSGYVLALSVCLLACVLFLVGRWPLKCANPVTPSDLTTLLASTFSAMAISFSSPGAAARRDAIDAQRLSTPGMLEIALAPLDGLRVWFGAVASPGSALTFAVLFGLTVLAVPNGSTTGAQRVALRGLLLTALSAVTALVSQAAGILTYSAWWHEVTARQFAWLGICCLAVSAAILVRSRWPGAMLAATWLLPIGLVMTYASLGNMAVDMLQRLDSWNQGPAPVVGIEDINVEWQKGYWLKLAHIRDDAPPRIE